MKRKLFLMLGCAFLSIDLITAQISKVTGVVLSEEDHEPVVGASVLIKGTTIGAITDIDGKFQLTNVPSDAKKVVISFIGLQSQELPIQAVMKVSLKSDTEVLDEVIVTGYGVMKKTTFTGAANIADAKVLESKSDANFMKALEGSMPGVQMNNSTSMPGAQASIYIRGEGSINSGTQPLFIIDGMPMNSDTDAETASYNRAFNPLANINAADIESVTVLKDANATAIYGSRAANGVVVITTKKGQEGAMHIDLDIKQGFTNIAPNNLTFCDAQQTADLFAQGLVNKRNSTYTYDEALAQIKKDYNWDGVSNYDWMDAITRTGYYQDYNISFSGGSTKTKFYASLGYLSQEGVAINSAMKRYSGRLNVESSYKYFSFGFNSSYAFADMDAFSQSTGGSYSNPFVAAALKATPLDPFYNEDGSYNMNIQYNPLAVYDEEAGDIYNTKTTTINLNPYLAINFGKGFIAKTSLGINSYGTRQYDFWSPYNKQGSSYNGLGTQYNSNMTTITWTNTLNWMKTFNERHNLSVMVGQEAQWKNYWNEEYSGYDFPMLGYRELKTAGASNGTPSYNTREARLASFFINSNYDFAGKYYAQVSYRRDGSSVFGTDNRWGNFWSVGGKWRISGEDFLKDNTLINNLSLRASYGTVGNQDIDWYAARGFYMTGSNYDNTPGITPGSLNNPNLGWEVSNKLNIGVDLTLANKWFFTLDLYNEVASDMLFLLPLSMTTGLEETYQNIGSMRNRGLEFGVNGTLLSTKGWTWTAYANITLNQNRITKLSDGKAIESTYSIMEEGRPLRQFYMVEYAGVDPETGSPLWYKNETGDETSSNWNECAKRYLGSADPKAYGGFGTRLRWNGFDFSADFNYRLGGKVYSSSNRFYLSTGTQGKLTPTTYVYENAWTENNRYTDVPQYIDGNTSGENNHSSRYLYSGNFLRVKNLQLGYTLPKSILSKALIENLRIYVSIDNLYTFKAKDFIGYDPETYTSGLIAFQYPSTRTFLAGITLGF